MLPFVEAVQQDVGCLHFFLLEDVVDVKDDPSSAEAEVETGPHHCLRAVGTADVEVH